MLLYEFTIIHNECLTDEPVNIRVKNILETQAHEQLWAFGYTYYIGKPKFLPGGDLEYMVTVSGEYDNE